MVYLGVFNVLRPKAPDEATMIHLKIIEMKLVTPQQFALFRGRVLRLIHKGRTEQVRPIVAGVATVISTQGQVLLGDSSTHGLRDDQVESLRNGWRQLGAIRVTLSLPGMFPSNLYQPAVRDETEEQAAIDNDTASFQAAVGLVIRPQQSGDVLVYDMTNPATPPVRVLRMSSPLIAHKPGSQPGIHSVAGLSTCRDVKRYLISVKKAGHPELWARQRGGQQHTPNGLRWIWLPLSDHIHGKHLEFVDRTDPNYIVVLKYENQLELPEPIDLAPIGEPCCHAQCGNLQAHLGSIWPQQIVARAVRIEDGTCVLTETFNAGLFDLRTNGLFVHLESRGSSNTG